MGQKILKDWQEQAIKFLASESDFKQFYLTGGTALTVFYLKHRISDDLDFFSYGDVDAIFIHKLADKLRKSLGAKEMKFSKVHDRSQFFYLLGKNDEVKVEFTHYPFKQLEATKSFLGIAIDSEYDIAVNKLATILDRFDPKDFIDLYFLLDKYALTKLTLSVQKKFGIKVEPLFLGGELAKVRRIKGLPKMLKPITLEKLKKRFEDEAKKLAPQILTK